MDPPLPLLANSLTSSPTKFPNIVCHVSQNGTVSISRVVSDGKATSEDKTTPDSGPGSAAQVTKVISITFKEEIQAHTWSQDGRVLVILGRSSLKVYEVRIQLTKGTLSPQI